MYKKHVIENKERLVIMTIRAATNRVIITIHEGMRNENHNQTEIELCLFRKSDALQLLGSYDKDGVIIPEKFKEFLKNRSQAEQETMWYRTSEDASVVTDTDHIKSVLASLRGQLTNQLEDMPEVLKHLCLEEPLIESGYLQLLS